VTIIIPANTLADATVDNASCRFNDGDSAYMHKNLGTVSSGTAGTFSCWVKRGVAGAQGAFFSSASDTNNKNQFYFTSGNVLEFYGKAGGSQNVYLQTTAVYRDPSAWYHLVLAWDTTQGTAANRVKLYVNGAQYTWDAQTTQPAEDAVLRTNVSGENFKIGATEGPTDYFDGYMAEVVFIDGTQYAASDFGQFDSDSPTIWKPKDVSGLTFGNNGFYLDFGTTASLGKDANGGTDLTEVNLAAADQATDSPTNNFATLNPLGLPVSNPATLSEGNCKIVLVGSSNADWGGGSTIGLSAGKWYWEVKPSNDISSSGSLIGVTDDPAEVARSSDQELTYTTPIGYGYKDNGNKRINLTGSEADTSYGDSYANDDIIGVALNMDDLELTFYKNGAVQNSGTAISMTASTHSGFYFPGTSKTGTATCTFEYNFGGCPAFALSSAANDGNGYGNFEYAPPSGFLAICTKNLGSDGG